VQGLRLVERVVTGKVISSIPSGTKAYPIGDFKEGESINLKVYSTKISPIGLFKANLSYQQETICEAKGVVLFRFNLRYRKIATRTQNLPYDVEVVSPKFPDPLFIASPLRDKVAERHFGEEKKEKVLFNGIKLQEMENLKKGKDLAVQATKFPYQTHNFLVFFLN